MPRKGDRILSASMVEKAIALHQSGYTLDNLAVMFGVSNTCLSKLMYEQGYSIKRPLLTAQELQNLDEIYNDILKLPPPMGCARLQ